jgi:hypothetical protein
MNSLRYCNTVLAYTRIIEERGIVVRSSNVEVPPRKPVDFCIR